MHLRKIQQKKAAIELSIGTVVIIVLAMTMLILGLVLIRSIFSGADESIRQIDQGVKNEINKLFTDNQDRKLILYPSSGIVKLEQGSQDSGFALSIRNINNNEPKIFSYRIVKAEQGSCSGGSPLDSGSADIVTGEQENGIQLNANSVMENPRHIRFAIADDAPTCTFRVRVEVYEGPTIGGGAPYEQDVMDIEIVQK